KFVVKSIERAAKRIPALEHLLARTLRVRSLDRAALEDVVALAPAAPLAPPPTALTPQAISDFKSGISLKPLGTYGVDYLVENWYHDPAVDPRCTVYVKSTTNIDFKHNS